MHIYKIIIILFILIGALLFNYYTNNKLQKKSEPFINQNKIVEPFESANSESSGENINFRDKIEQSTTKFMNLDVDYKGKSIKELYDSLTRYF